MESGRRVRGRVRVPEVVPLQSAARQTRNPSEMQQMLSSCEHGRRSTLNAESRSGPETTREARIHDSFEQRVPLQQKDSFEWSSAGNRGRALSCPTHRRALEALAPFRLPRQLLQPRRLPTTRLRVVHALVCRTPSTHIYLSAAKGPRLPSATEPRGFEHGAFSAELPDQPLLELTSLDPFSVDQHCALIVSSAAGTALDTGPR